MSPDTRRQRGRCIRTDTPTRPSKSKSSNSLSSRTNPGRAGTRRGRPGLSCTSKRSARATINGTVPDRVSTMNDDDDERR